MNPNIRDVRAAKAMWRGIYRTGRHNAGTRTGRRVDNRAHKRRAKLLGKR